MKTQEAIFSAFNASNQSEVIDNTFEPKQTTHGHRKAFWTNYNSKLVDRISEIKANQNN